MKKLSMLLSLFAILFLTTSCGVNYALIENQNQNSTQVHLTTNNYTVVEQVTGSADVSYVLGIGGLNKTQLYANAYADMVSSANLKDGSRALINIVTEEQVGGVPPFYTKRVITVSAHVIEFNR
jgi:hypothetical protein